MDKNSIAVEINNGRAMELAQWGENNPITATTYSTISGDIDGCFEISPADLVRMVEWYTYQKNNGNEHLTF